MTRFDPHRYGPACAALLELPISWEFGPGEPNAAARPMLAQLSTATLFPGVRPSDLAMAKCCLSGLWLMHNFLDESHALSQEIHTPSGSYWHGIMHRREPDYSNAKYWFRQVGIHPICDSLREAARELASQSPADSQVAFLNEQHEWEPFRFVDLCQAVAQGRAASGEICRAVTRVEWELLFDHCYREAIRE